jgi:four helix bundle protein
VQRRIPEFARFLDSAIKSTSELESQLERTHGYGLMGAKRYDWFITEVQDVRKMTWQASLPLTTENG